MIDVKPGEGESWPTGLFFFRRVHILVSVDTW